QLVFEHDALHVSVVDKRTERGFVGLRLYGKLVVMRNRRTGRFLLPVRVIQWITLRIEQPRIATCERRNVRAAVLRVVLEPAFDDLEPLLGIQHVNGPRQDAYVHEPVIAYDGPPYG